MADNKKRFVLELTARDQAEKVLKALGRTGFKEARRLGRGFNQVAEKDLPKVRREVGRVGRAMKSAFGKTGRLLRSSFIPALLGVATAFAGLSTIKAAAQNAAAFQLAIGEVETILPETTRDVGRLTEELLKLSVAQGENEVIVAKGMYQTISAGITDAADAMQVLDVAGRLAIGGLADTATTVNVITTVLNAFQMSASKAGHVADVLFTTVRQGKTTISELSAAIAVALPSANALGVSFEEVSAAIATLTKQGFTTSEATTLLNALFSQLAKRAVDINKAMSKVGFSFNDQTLKTRELRDVLEELRIVTGDSMTRAFDVLGARKESVLALFGLTGIQARVFQTDLEATADASGNLGRAFDKIADKDAFKLQQALQATRVGFLGLGNAVLRSLTEAVEGMGGLTTVQATFEQVALRIKPVITELLDVTAEWVAQFVIAEDGIGRASLKAEQFAIQVGLAFDQMKALGVATGVLDDRTSRLAERTSQRWSRDIEKMGTAWVGIAKEALEEWDHFAVRNRDLINKITANWNNAVTNRQKFWSDDALDESLLQERTKLFNELADAADKYNASGERAAAIEAAKTDAAKEKLVALQAELDLMRELDALGISGFYDTSSLDAFAGQPASSSGYMQDLQAKVSFLGEMTQSITAIAQGSGQELDLLEAQKPFQELLLSLEKAAAVTAAEKLAVRQKEFSVLEEEVRATADSLALSEENVVALDAVLERLKLIAETPDKKSKAPDDPLKGVTTELLRGVPGKEAELALAQMDFDLRSARIDQLYEEGLATLGQAEALRTLNAASLEHQQSMIDTGKLTELNRASMNAFVTGGINQVENALVGVVSGSKSAGEAFKDLAAGIVHSLIRMATQLLVTNILLAIYDAYTTYGQGTRIASTSVSAISALSNPQYAQMMADGGIVNQPTLALLGEAGPEMVLPMSPSRGLTQAGTNAALDRYSGGSGGGGQTIQPVIVINAIDARSGMQFLDAHADRIASGIAAKIGYQADITNAVRRQAGGVPGL